MTEDAGFGSRRLRRQAWRIVLAGYAGLALLVLTGFDSDLVSAGILFVGANLWISATFVWLERVRPLQPLHILIYGMYLAAYVVKAVLLPVTGLNTPFTILTIRTTVGVDGYMHALLMATFGHLIVVAVLLLASRVFKAGVFVPRKRYLSNSSVNGLSLALLGWVIVSSVVMYAYGVAVMGTEGVSLPFKMSAVLYYSRLIAVPMVLLYFTEKAVVRDDAPLLKRSLALFGLLAVAEVMVRATKAPPFIMVLQVVFLLILLAQQGERLSDRTRRELVRVLAVVFGVGLVLWPLMEVYRSGMVVGVPMDVLAMELQDQLAVRRRGLVVASLEGVFNRLVGFLELVGLLSTPEFRHSLGVVVQYGDIATYYTRHYLGYSIVGHSSSPSMLGAAWILGGPSLWYFVLFAYLVVLRGAWQLLRRLPHLAVPVGCFIAAEAANVVIAGTLDASVVRLAMVFFIGLIGEVLLRTGIFRRSGI